MWLELSCQHNEQLPICKYHDVYFSQVHKGKAIPPKQTPSTICLPVPFFLANETRTQEEEEEGFHNIFTFHDNNTEEKVVKLLKISIMLCVM